MQKFLSSTSKNFTSFFFLVFIFKVPFFFFCQLFILRLTLKLASYFCRYRGWLARRLCYVLFVQERDVHKGMFAKNLTENVLNNSR